MYYMLTAYARNYLHMWPLNLESERLRKNAKVALAVVGLAASLSKKYVASIYCDVQIKVVSALSTCCYFFVAKGCYS